MRSEPIVDGQGRRLGNLRLSLTSACNYACIYCVADGKRLQARNDSLSLDKLLLAVEYLKTVNPLGRLRITGGEPLISPLFDGFLGAVGRLGFEDVSLTSNGQLLSRKLPLLLAAGVKRINISLDTLDAEAFQRIARGGDLATVLDGIDQALEAGLQVKINMVPLLGHNHDQILSLLEYCLARGVELRFIELMRMGHLARDDETFRRQFYGMAEILEVIGQHHPFSAVPSAPSATALRFNIPGRGHFGVIANASAPFCCSCNRVRLSSSGWLHGCLSSSQSHYLGDALELPRDLALSRIRELSRHALLDKQPTHFTGDLMIMKVIGG
ncbi:radical SAM protein [Pseudomonas sp. WS 5413]|uniref:GTP 3',8-cyclase MoaA n=1 Tax=Pseudomonas sp. WS 5413 TaxID=2717488 RepID=UPI001474AC0D|nr:radical SAM protein [Pseudomonas sp. WS 5413]NMX34120.1 radical SAM protein [Pseudomonas sp. WS 5413]